MGAHSPAPTVQLQQNSFYSFPFAKAGHVKLFVLCFPYLAGEYSLHGEHITDGPLLLIHAEKMNSRYHYLPTTFQMALCHFIPPTLPRVPVPDVACRCQNHCHSATLSSALPGLETS